MSTAIDTNIIFDLLRTKSPHHPNSLIRFQHAKDRGDVIICDVVYAELVPQFEDQEALDKALEELGVIFSPTNSLAAYEAGLRWGRYREAGGSRERMIADFLIGAHALMSADSFLTRDRGFFATYFPELPRAQ